METGTGCSSRLQGPFALGVHGLASASVFGNVVYKRVDITSKWSPHQLSATRKTLTVMAPTTQAQPASREADTHLAISALQQNQIQAEAVAAQTFDVPRTTLHRRRAGKPARRDCQPNSKKLTEVEEEVIIRYILDLDQRGFSPTYAAVRDMADKLLAARGAGQVGVHWPRNFVKRTDSLTTRFNRAYDRQRALCEDPVLIRS
jgi:hypothetical protein